MAFFSRKQIVDDVNITDESQVDYLDAPDTKAPDMSRMGGMGGMM